MLDVILTIECSKILMGTRSVDYNAINSPKPIKFKHFMNLKCKQNTVQRHIQEDETVLNSPIEIKEQPLSDNFNAID